MKNILLLGGSGYYIDTIKSVKELGYVVHLLDKNPDAPGFDVADYGKPFDFSDRNLVYRYAIENKINAIMPLNDFGTRSAFYVSQKMGLISPPYISAIASNDKGIMRDVWSHEKLPQPDYVVFNKTTDIDYIIDKIGFPMIVKPTDAGGGGRGISVARNNKDLVESINIASEYVNNDRFIAEVFIEGIEVTVESLVFDNSNYAIAISDKVKAPGKARVATLLSYPSLFSDHIEVKIKELVSLASDALGVNYGATHTELIVGNDGDIYLIEMATRPGGSHIQGVIVKETSGIDFPKEIAKILCGEKPVYKPLYHKGCAYLFFNPRERGVIKKIVVDHDKIKQNPNLVRCEITAKVGDHFSGLDNSLKRVGYIISRGETRDEAIKNAHQLEKNVQFIIG